MNGFWAGLGEGVLGLVYPRDETNGERDVLKEPYCQACGEPFEGRLEDFVCTNCRGRNWYLERARAAYRAEGAVRELIHEFKYARRFHHLPVLGEWLFEGFRRFYAQRSWDGLVPVPLYPLRKRERGFNQAAELAGWLGKKTNLPVWDVLKRVKQTETQANLRKSDRLRNQRGAFDLRDGVGPTLKRRRFLIVDDVFTTGATVNACAMVLRRRGKTEPPCVLTVARG